MNCWKAEYFLVYIVLFQIHLTHSENFKLRKTEIFSIISTRIFSLEIFSSGVRQEQDIYVRLIDSVTKQVRK